MTCRSEVRRGVAAGRYGDLRAAKERVTFRTVTCNHALWNASMALVCMRCCTHPLTVTCVHARVRPFTHCHMLCCMNQTAACHCHDGQPCTATHAQSPAGGSTGNLVLPGLNIDLSIHISGGQLTGVQPQAQSATPCPCLQQLNQQVQSAPRWLLGAWESP